MHLKPLIFFASGIAISWGQTVADVLNDITGIKTQATALNDAIDAFPASGGNLIQALAIHTQAGNVQSQVDKTTTDVNATPAVSEPDGQAVLSAVQGLEPVIIAALNNLEGKKAAFAALPIGGASDLVLSDLQNLNTSTGNLETALIAKSPSDLLNQAQTIIAQITSAFNSAIAAFS